MLTANRKSQLLRIPYMDTKQKVIAADPAARLLNQVIGSANFGLVDQAKAPFLVDWTFWSTMLG
jgi:hypothetical protein